MNKISCKIKFCGMTNLDDCLAAIDLGVDFMGFVFYRKSKRYITPEAVRGITDRLEGGRVKTVGVFVEETEEQVRDLLHLCHLDYAQIYSPMSLSNRISVVRVKDRAPDVEEREGLVLFDRYTPAFGGSGIALDLNLLRDHGALSRAFIAGGINEENVSRALELHPYGIDLVSSVEACPGKKDLAKMKSFVNKVRSLKS